MKHTNAQVSYSVTIEWTDYNCNCNSPITREARFELWDYPPGQDPIYNSGWEEPNSNPFTIYASGAIEDCESDCYLVKGYLRYTDNNGVCCTGYIQETCTGQELYYGFTFAIVMTME